MDNFFNNKIFKVAISSLLLVFIVLIILLIAAMFGKSYEHGVIERELLVNTLATILSAYMGILGSILGIFGTYYLFIFQRKEERNNNKIFIKEQLKASLQNIHLLSFDIQNIYVKNFVKYHDLPEWKREDITSSKTTVAFFMMDITSSKTTGAFFMDIEFLEKIRSAIDAFDNRYNESEFKNVLKSDIADISDIYLFIKKLDEKFNKELLDKYICNKTLDNNLIDKAIYLELPIDPIRDWIKIINREKEYIDIFQFIGLQKEIQSIVDTI